MGQSGRRCLKLRLLGQHMVSSGMGKARNRIEEGHRRTSARSRCVLQPDNHRSGFCRCDVVYFFLRVHAASLLEDDARGNGYLQRPLKVRRLRQHTVG
jgi:hypothetical protein